MTAPQRPSEPARGRPGVQRTRTPQRVARHRDLAGHTVNACATTDNATMMAAEIGTRRDVRMLMPLAQLDSVSVRQFGSAGGGSHLISCHGVANTWSTIARHHMR